MRRNVVTHEKCREIGYAVRCGSFATVTMRQHKEARNALHGDLSCLFVCH
jgi:hypothetical protein